LRCAAIVFNYQAKSAAVRRLALRWLILDQPLLGWYECGKWRKIAILTGEQSQIDYSQLRSWWEGQHVTIDGKLGRFVSALVSPSVFIEITTIKKH
jgi:hypothetical protein